MEHQFKEYDTPISSNNFKEKKKFIQLQRSDPCSDCSYRLLYPDILKIPRSRTFKNVNDAIEEKDVNSEECEECNKSLEPYCHVKVDSIIKLKDSTKKLLNLLDEIQYKTHSKIENLTLESFLKPNAVTINNDDDTDNINIPALRKLEYQANNLEAIYVPEEEQDDCSIYKRLTRKCHCLNKVDYNDFIIHFNEETKYSTNNIGEIIKNIKILKKFLYMGGNYTNNALMFLNEGLSDSQATEKIEITQGCSHADICNIFDDHSIVVKCISWPCKNDYFGDSTTQALAAGLLYKLAEVEEGRRYLNFSTRITNDIRKVIRKKSTVLETDIIESLNSTLDSLKPTFSKHLSKSIYEGFGFKTMNELLKFRQYMTLDEILTHLHLLKSFSTNDNGKIELTTHLRSLLILFKNMLMEYNNSEMNITITHILNNIVSKNIVKTNDQEESKIRSFVETSTEPVKMRNEIIQIPPKQKSTSKKAHKGKISLGIAPTKNRQPSIRQVSEWEPYRILNKSKKFTKDLRRSIIIVPLENHEDSSQNF